MFLLYVYFANKDFTHKTHDLFLNYPKFIKWWFVATFTYFFHHCCIALTYNEHQYKYVPHLKKINK